MLRSMFAAVSGLRTHQTMMDVVGNNISNVNTAGFKASRTTFQDAMNQVLRGGSSISDDRAGTNPMQIGLGSQVSSVDTVFGQGSIQLTGRATDVAIQGDGFFVVDVGGQAHYTRAGAFNVDATGALVGPAGSRVMGWAADVSGAVNSQGPLSPISLPTGQIISPKATTEIVMGGNLPAGAAVATTVTTSITIYDEQGVAHDLRFEFRKLADVPPDNNWEVEAFEGAVSLGAATPLAFDGVNGTLNTPPTGEFTVTLNGQAMTVRLNEAGQELVQLGGQTTAEARSQDGTAMGFLRGFEIGADGSISGRFSNGQTKALGVLAVATFANPAGLQKLGDNLFVQSLNSGAPSVTQAGVGEAGTLSPGSLEMSNVDLAQEFTNLIVAQRGFQANARSISASDEMLADIVNLKR